MPSPSFVASGAIGSQNHLMREVPSLLRNAGWVKSKPMSITPATTPLPVKAWGRAVENSWFHTLSTPRMTALVSFVSFDGALASMHRMFGLLSSSPNMSMGKKAAQTAFPKSCSTTPPASRTAAASSVFFTRVRM